jgi:pimeloyl-ACP methyl ester carboxylesterase
MSPFFWTVVAGERTRGEGAMYSRAKYGEDRFVEVEGHRIHYVKVGTGHPVLLIAGSYSTYRAWNRLLPLLSGEYRLLALDYLGVGDSDRPKNGFKYTVQEQAELIARMIEKLELGRVHLIGGSYGGAIVLYLPARYPNLVGKVVSIEGGVVRPEEMPTTPLEFILRYPVVGDLFIALLKTGWLDETFVRLIVGERYDSIGVRDRSELLEQFRHNARSASRIPWYWITASYKTSESFDGIAKSMRTPILYLYGVESDFRENLVEPNISFLEAHLPNARIVGLEGGGHDLGFEKPRETADLILDFFAEG